MSNESPNDDEERLVEGLLAGDESAYAQLVGQYADRLRHLADRKLSPAVRRRVEADDVVQSVCRTFFRRVHQGQFEVPDEARLWSLLCAITIAKTNEQLRFHLRQRRNPNQERHFESASPDSPASYREPAAGDPSTEQELELNDQFDAIMAELDDEERTILEMKLQGTANDAIAKKLGCSDRTIRRILQRLQSQFERAFETM